MIRFSRRFGLGFCCAAGVVVSLSGVLAFGYQGTADAVDAKEYQQVVSKAVSYLKTEGQAEDGSFSGKAGTGPTSLVITGLLEVGQSPNDPLVAKALKFLEANFRADGGIYAENSRHKNYETCIAVLLSLIHI